MYARVTRVKSDPGRVDELVQQLKTQMIPVFEQQKGYLGVLSSADRQTGQGATSTFWDSMENLKASEAAIFAARDKFAAEQGAEVISFHRVEILVREGPFDPKVGNHIRVVTLSGVEPGKVDGLVERFRKDIAPALRAQPGNRAAILQVDRDNNLAFGVSAFETAEQRDAAGKALDDLRDETSAKLGLKVESTMHAETTLAEIKAPVTS